MTLNFYIMYIFFYLRLKLYKATGKKTKPI